MRLSKAAREAFKKLGREGGLARAQSLTPERRKEIARLGYQASLAKLKKAKAS